MKARRKFASSRDHLIALSAVGASLIAAILIHPWLPQANLSPLFLTAVLWVSVHTSTAPALLAAFMSAIAYDFFLEPRYFLMFHDRNGLFTIGFFLLMVLIGGQLAGRLRRQMLALRAANEQTQSLLDLGRRLAPLADLEGVRRETIEVLARYLRLPSVLLTPDGTDGGLLLAVRSDPKAALDERDWNAARWSYQQGLPSGTQSKMFPEIGWRFIPLTLDLECFGIIGIQYPDEAPPTSIELAALDGLVGHATLAMARTRLVDHLERAKLSEEKERLRSALLSSVSHDLRTPLASMIGAASSLRTLAHQLTAQDRDELLDALLSEGERLNRYIQNLLDMTRLGQEDLKLDRDWIAIEDILSSVLRRLREMLTGHRVERRILPDLPLLYVQPALIEQALVNVLENAVKFSPREGLIEISAHIDGQELLLCVSDQGPGIPEKDRARVFDMFFTVAEGDRGKQGSGLGLAICGGIVAAHGGRVEALPGSSGRGTSIRIRLPLQDLPSATEAQI